MYAVLLRTGNGDLQPIGTKFPSENGDDGCAYVPLFPTVEFAEAWVKDAGYDWTCIAQCGLDYTGYTVKRDTQ